MDRPRRDFSPSKTVRYGRPTFSPDKLVKYSPKHRHARLMNFPFSGSFFRPRMRSVVISVDGASRGNNRANPSSRGAWGVYWGPGCESNRCGTLGPEEAQSSGYAELEAVRQGLLSVRDRRRDGDLDGWREIIIKLDSDYVKKTLDEYVWKWEGNDWKRSGGKRIENHDLVQDIHAMICDMEDDMAVRFWRVNREWNQDADALANQALYHDSDSEALFTGGIRLPYRIEFGISFAAGEIAWRFPIAFQIVFALVILLFIPDLVKAPRWLILNGQKDEAMNVLLAPADLSTEDEYVTSEFAAIQDTVLEIESATFQDLTRIATSGA